MTNLDEIEEIFNRGTKAIREYEKKCVNYEIDFLENRRKACEIVEAIKEEKAK